MIKDYFMAIKAKHDIKSKEKLSKNAQKKALISLLNRIVSIYIDKGVTSEDINLDTPIDTAYFVKLTSNIYNAKNVSFTPRSYRYILKWGIKFYLKFNPASRNVSYYI